MLILKIIIAILAVIGGIAIMAWSYIEDKQTGGLGRR